MEFGILGPLTVSVDGRPAPVSGTRAQRALGGLLLQDGRSASIDSLVEFVWDEPPATARQQIHTVVYRLRRLLGERLHTDGGGYRLDLAGCRLDAADFLAGVRHGRALIAAGDLPGGVRELRAALRLWRGRPFDGVPGERIAAHATRLEEERLAALEECAEAQLRLGQSRGLVPQLQALVAEHPLREGFAALLMAALTRDGRQADAIAHYHRVVATLRDDLGVEPGHRLREAYLATLREADRPEPVVSPGMLPRPPRRLVGRDAELGRLLAGARDGARPHIVVVDGMAGVGKSALVLTAAHALAAELPELRLHIDLQGHGEGAPVTPHDALGLLLRRLGLRPPGDPDERAELWRHQLHGRRGVVVLDNAGGAAQVEPLLPHDSPSVVLVTSRTRLGPIDGAAVLSLEPLDAAAGVELLRETTDERVDADPAAAGAVVGLCGGLPLAIRLVGHHLQHRPRWTVGMLAGELASAELSPVTLGAERRSVAAAFELSYRRLDEPARRLFRRLGLHPAGPFAVEAAAALDGAPVAETRERLEHLVEANLVQPDVPGRYRLHDLLHAYAASLVTAGEGDAAAERMIAYYLAELEDAGKHLESIRQGWEAPRAADGASWVSEHWRVIVALTELAAARGAHRDALALARMAWPSARVFGFSAEALRLAERILPPAVAALGDDPLVAAALTQIAGVHLRLGRFGDCRGALEAAEEMYRRLGNEQGALSIATNRIVLVWSEGRLTEALALGESVGAAARAAGEAQAEIGALGAAAGAAYQLGRHDLALTLLERACGPPARTTLWFSIGLGWLGKVHLALGRTGPAAALLVWAISLKRQHGNHGGAAELLSTYGRLVAAAGDPQAGLRLVRTAFEQACALADGQFQPIVANDLGELLTALGRTAEAAQAHERALRDPRPYERARAHAGLAAARRTSDPAAAAAARAAAVAGFAAMGLDEAAIARWCPPL